MNKLICWLLICFMAQAYAEAPRFTVVQNDQGAKIQKDGQDFLIRGMNWGVIPVGENYAYDFWAKPDAEIQAILDQEMPMMQSIGVNAIRQFSMIPPKWVTYIYEKYGIYTLINHLMGRYGFAVEGVMQSPVDYSNRRLRDAIKKDVLATVEKYKNTPGVLMWMLGNENNYGLSWSSSEIENLPQGERDAARAKHLYSLFGEVTQAIKQIDQQHLVSICNGDLQYIELIAQEASAIDVLGTNVYRGKTSTDLFSRVKTVLNKPVFFSEFGSDAFNARSGREDGIAQAELIKSQWLDLYQNTYGQGAGNAVGGFIFQWSDEWWKYKQTENLTIHDHTASWSNQAYGFDYQEGSNNMNEEWFGIMAKGRSDTRGRYQLTPRPAYFMLRDIFTLDPYTGPRSAWVPRFVAIDPRQYEPQASAMGALERVAELEKLYLKSANIHLEAVQSVGHNTNKTLREGWSPNDHMEAATLEWGWRPDPRLEASAAVNILGHVAGNKMDEIFYENRGLPVEVMGSDGKVVTIKDPERVKLHRARFEWNEDYFLIEGFYRTPHGHWADEGDMFGMYQETYDIAGIDRYNSDAPNGFVFTGKSALVGLKVAFGPQVYWGAKPMAIVKYSFPVQDATFSLMHEQAFGEQAEAASSSSLSDPGGRAGKSSLTVKVPMFGLQTEWGLLSAGREKIGDHYLKTEPVAPGAGYHGSEHEITDSSRIIPTDALAGKLRVVRNTGRLPWFVQGAYRGLVANSGGDAAITITKWTLKPSERGNQYNVSAGFSAGFGSFSLAPQMVYQKPLVGPVPHDPLLNSDQFDAATGVYTPGIRPRNLLNDTFAVLDNREMIGAELLFVYDPTPDNWMFAWDSDDRESAPFAASLDLVYRKFPTIRDSNLGVLGDGSVFAFSTSPPAAGLWDAVLRTVHVPNPEVRLLNQFYAGTGQANGDSQRLIKRFGLGSTLRWKRLQGQVMAKWNDWGPYDYYRDYNLTFPFQTMASFSYGIEPFRVDRQVSQIGLRFQYRTLDEYSPRYPYIRGSGRKGDEQEWTSYVDINI